MWIVPERAVVYEHGTTAFVLESHFKVMLEEDYLALQAANEKMSTTQNADIRADTLEVIREIIIPEIEKEVNEGKNFALLRQITNSLILAVWYKKTLQENLLGKIYVNKKKVKGVDVKDPLIQSA